MLTVTFKVLIKLKRMIAQKQMIALQLFASLIKEKITTDMTEKKR